LLDAVAFSVELPSIVFEEHVVFVDSYLDVFEISDVPDTTLVCEQLILFDSLLLHGHDELFAVSDDVI